MAEPRDAERDKETHPFERFVDLTKRLVSVPKKEIDRKAKELDGNRKPA
jgi:hypothetical protein